MEIIDQFAEFEWDRWNSDKNIEKHGVGGVECEEAFLNQPLYVYYDERHSQDEERYYILGRTNSSRLLFIVFTRRNNKIRVISARDMNRKERGVYHEKAKSHPEV